MSKQSNTSNKGKQSSTEDQCLSKYFVLALMHYYGGGLAVPTYALDNGDGTWTEVDDPRLATRFKTREDAWIWKLTTTGWVWDWRVLTLSWAIDAFEDYQKILARPRLPKRNQSDEDFEAVCRKFRSLLLAEPQKTVNTFEKQNMGKGYVFSMSERIDTSTNKGESIIIDVDVFNNANDPPDYSACLTIEAVCRDIRTASMSFHHMALPELAAIFTAFNNKLESLIQENKGKGENPPAAKEDEQKVPQES
jgi:hypothetical protein